MTPRPAVRLSGVTLDSPDPPRLARFYAGLLGWTAAVEDPADPVWATVRDPAGGVGIACQHDEGYVPPIWPSRPGAQRMMAHLEIAVEDLAAASAFAIGLGATMADHQPQDDVRVMLDPDGHPFCLWVEVSGSGG